MRARMPPLDLFIQDKTSIYIEYEHYFAIINFWNMHAFCYFLNNQNPCAILIMTGYHSIILNYLIITFSYVCEC